jgi:hypothetical protein
VPDHRAPSEQICRISDLCDVDLLNGNPLLLLPLKPRCGRIFQTGFWPFQIFRPVLVCRTSFVLSSETFFRIRFRMIRSIRPDPTTNSVLTENSRDVWQEAGFGTDVEVIRKTLRSK